jgi:hypothetical protein
MRAGARGLPQSVSAWVTKERRSLASAIPRQATRYLLHQWSGCPGYISTAV